MAPKAPLVMKMSGVSNAMPWRAMIDWRTTSTASGSLVLYANHISCCGVMWRRSASVISARGISCGLPKQKSAMPGSPGEAMRR